jgi:four helix bundle suffix protein
VDDGGERDLESGRDDHEGINKPARNTLEAQYVRKLGYQRPITYETYREFCETRPAEVVANIALCLIHQTNYLLDRQIRWLEQDFVKEGGLRERMTPARLQHRKKNE